MTEGTNHDVTVGRTLESPKGSIIAVDKGYNDYAWHKQLTDKGIFFVTRLKINAKYRTICRRPVLKNKGLICDQTIVFTGIYKARWQVELFFKWIKQNLKIKSFVGTSKNAVMTQIWIALCVYLLLAFLKFQSKLQKSTQQILRLLQLNLFEKRDLLALLRGDPPRDYQPDVYQIALL